MTKKCTKCGFDKIEDEFALRGSKGRHSTCKQCKNEYNKTWYVDNIDTHKAAVAVNKSIRRAELLGIIRTAKDVPCADCGHKYEYYCMDFDHVRGKKKFDLSKAVRLSVSLESLYEEMAKCDVVCAICHRKRTFCDI